MARFFVGQRVRVVYAPAFPEAVGRETRISGPAYGESADQGYDWIVVIDGEEYAARSHSLEPILPEGHRAGEDGKCELLDELLERQREVV